MADETKMPCEPMGEAGRDYNELGIFRYKENNPTLEAAQTLWAFLPAWMVARDMVSVDAKYNKRISGLIAENAAIILKAAQEMAESEPEASGHDGTHLCKALGITPNELFGIEPQDSTSNCRFQTFNP